MKIDVLTLFPEMINSYCNCSILKRACETDVITVNTINPGWVDTTLGKASIEDSDFSIGEIMDIIPQKRLVEPVEVAKLVKYLASEDAKGITGQLINLCAGLSVGI